MNIEKKLREIRQSKKLTIRALSKKSGVSSSYISDLENGKNNKPSIDILVKLANALEVSPSELFGIKSSEVSQLLKQLDMAIAERLNEINDKALNGMIAIGRYSSLDDEMEILKKATDKQIENILDSLGSQLELELFKLKKVIENE